MSPYTNIGVELTVEKVIGFTIGVIGLTAISQNLKNKTLD